MPGQGPLGAHAAPPLTSKNTAVSLPGLTTMARMGPMEESVRKDLSRLPKDLAEGGIAATALYAAKQLDGLDNAFDLPARDAAAFLAQMRHCLVQLRDWAPGEVQDDPTEVKRKSREERLLGTVTDISVRR